MNKKVLYSTIKRVAFVAVFGYFLPIFIGIRFDSLLFFQKTSFWFSPLLGIFLFFFGLFLIFGGIANLISFGEGSPNPSFPTKKLVKKGLYRFMRHPIYFGWLTIILAASIYFSSISILVFLFIIMIFVYFYAKKEEKIMERRFGRDYLNYKRKVRGWIPKIL